MNTLNYVDRYAFFAVGSHIQNDLQIDDFWFGWLGSAFMIVYTVVAPFTGWLGDRYNRKLLIFGGVGLWSLATVGAAFSADFYHMFFWRSLLGIGEASYGVIAPALLADLFPVERARPGDGCLLPGAARRHGAGIRPGRNDRRCAGMASRFSGRRPAGATGRLRGPRHAATRAAVRPKSPASKVKTARPGMSDYLELIKTKTFVFNTLGMAAVTFATGAYAAWGVDVLSAQCTDCRQRRGRPANRHVAGRGRPDRNRPGHVRARPPLQAHQTGLSAARRRWRFSARPRWASSASSTTTQTSRWASCSARRSCCRWCWGRAIP